MFLNFVQIIINWSIGWHATKHTVDLHHLSRCYPHFANENNSKFWCNREKWNLSSTLFNDKAPTYDFRCCWFNNFNSDFSVCNRVGCIWFMWLHSILCFYSPSKELWNKVHFSINFNINKYFHSKQWWTHIDIYIESRPKSYRKKDISTRSLWRSQNIIDANIEIYW